MSEVKLTNSSDSVWIEYIRKNGEVTKKETPMKNMTDAQLKRAKQYSQAQVLKYHNKASAFDLLVDKLNEEAENRNISLEDYDRQFFKNEQILKSKMKKNAK